MPSTSKKQHNFMAAVANNPAFAKKVGVPQSVGKDFNNADKGRKFSKGGSMPMKPGMRGFQTLTAPMTRNMGSTRAGAKYMKEGGMTKDSGFDDDVKNVKSNLYMQKGDDKVYSKVRGLGPGMAAKRLEGRGVDVKGLAGNRANEEDSGSYKKGGMAKADMKQDKGMMQKAVNKHEGRLHKGSPMTKLAGGGMAASKMGSVKSSSSRDGIATKGKTKGTMITMKNGGKC